ncbi:hypothetical protein [Streptomyces sp. NPDC057702]|uniref:helix-turn-helix transcriptional regulator n=1 Tax=unclassified Streptomyces TaxID=2593676 RepID=UPI0036880D8E
MPSTSVNKADSAVESFGGPEPTVPVPRRPTGPPLSAASRISAKGTERVLVQTRRLFESVADRGDAEGQLLATLDPAEGTGAVERAIDSAERSLAIVLSECGDSAAARIVPRLGQAVDRGVEARLLAGLGLLEHRSFVELLDTYAPGVDVRLVREPLHEAVLADGTVGVAWSRPGPAVGGTAVVRAPDVLRNLRTLFQVSWTNSPAFTDYRRLSEHVRSDTARRILLALSSGRTDEAAARGLSMSVRTYRRYVAEIIRELGANSRFQAGARAVELGLLPATARSV